MKKYLLLAGMAIFLGCGGNDGGEVLISDAKSDSGPSDVGVDSAKDSAIEASVSDGGFDYRKPLPDKIIYSGGPVMSNPIDVYLIWYGDWKGSNAVPIIEYLTANVGKSDYFKINSHYYELPPSLFDAGVISVGDAGVIFELKPEKRFVSTDVIFAKSIFVGYPNGTNLAESGVQNVVYNILETKQLPTNDNAIYVVLTSKDVDEGNSLFGFCSSYCGWHDSKTINGSNIKFAFIGDTEKCPNDCSVKSAYLSTGHSKSPNEDWSADGMASVLTHELEEAATDPDPFVNVAWQDDNGWENADICAWTYGPVYETKNNSVANVKIGNKDYLIQQNWVLDESGGHCGLHE